jgi:hypothetical protein
MGEWLLVGLTALAATLPFLNKAFHVDDVLYLFGAAQVLRGHDAYHGVVLWDAKDGQPAAMFDTDFNPPLWKYVLAAAIHLFGHAEWKLHLVTSVFVVAAAYGVFQVSRRWSRHPIWCTAMIVLGPFFLPAQNIMLEGPVLCLAIWAVECQLRAAENGRTRWSWLAGLFLALAIFTKYTAALLLIVLLLHAYTCRRPRLLIATIPFVGGLMIWLLHNILLYGRSHVWSHGVTYDVGEWPVRVLIVLRCVGSVTVFGPAIVVLLLRGGRGTRWFLCAAVLLAALAAALDVRQAQAYRELEGWRLTEVQTQLQTVHFFCFTFHGALTVLGLVGCLAHRWRVGGRQSSTPAVWIVPGTWLTVTFLFNVVSVPFNAIRHLHFFLVALVGLTDYLLQESMPAGSWRRGLLVGSTVLAFALATADYEFANTYRTVARNELSALVRQLGLEGRRVWFMGTWGFAYYARPGGAGALPWLREPRAYGFPDPQPGDRIVRPELLTWHALAVPPGLAAKPVAHWQPPAVCPLRTVSSGVHYYAVLRHTLPWQILVTRSEDPAAFYELPDVDEILVYELTPAENARPESARTP